MTTLNTRKPSIQLQKRIVNELKAVGVSRMGLHLPESHYLSNVLFDDEHINGVVYGHHTSGLSMMVATDRRIMYLNIKPLFSNVDEINFDVVSGVSYTHAGFGSTVTLHTRIKDYAIQTMNQKCASRFVQVIESRIVRLL